MNVVILAGGRGTRFWPLSRRHRPKQLLALLGGQTMLERTLERGAALVGEESVYVVADRGLDWPIHEAIPGLPEERCIWEPRGRNTAPALILAALTPYPGARLAVAGALEAAHAEE